LEWTDKHFRVERNILSRGIVKGVGGGSAVTNTATWANNIMLSTGMVTYCVQPSAVLHNTVLLLPGFWRTRLQPRWFQDVSEGPIFAYQKDLASPALLNFYISRNLLRFGDKPGYGFFRNNNVPIEATSFRLRDNLLFGAIHYQYTHDSKNSWRILVNPLDPSISCTVQWYNGSSCLDKSTTTDLLVKSLLKTLYGSKYTFPNGTVVYYSPDGASASDKPEDVLTTKVEDYLTTPGLSEWLVSRHVSPDAACGDSGYRVDKQWPMAVYSGKPGPANADVRGCSVESLFGTDAFQRWDTWWHAVTDGDFDSSDCYHADYDALADDLWQTEDFSISSDFRINLETHANPFSPNPGLYSF